MKRLSILALGLGLAAVVLSGQTARADDGPGRAGQPAVDVPAETAIIRDMLTDAVRAYHNGDFNRAYYLSRQAYLDHFEAVEIPLRIREPDLTLDMEYRFAELRSKMQAGAAYGEVESALLSVRSGLEEIDHQFQGSGAIAPGFALVSSFSIIFREGLEAVLLIAAMLGYLESSNNRTLKRYLLYGVGLGILTSAVAWGLVSTLVNLAPVGRELLEAAISLVAVVVLFLVSFWLLRKLETRRWMEFLKAQVWAAMAAGSATGLMTLGFSAVFREGLETALFYQVLGFMGRYLEGYILAGFLAGVVALLGVVWIMFRAGRKLPVRTYLSTAATIIMLLSITFAGQAVYEFQSAGLIGVTSLVSIVPRLPRVLAELTGFHPTAETLAAQAILALIYAGGALAAWWLKNRRPAAVRRQPSAASVQSA